MNRRLIPLHVLIFLVTAAAVVVAAHQIARPFDLSPRLGEKAAFLRAHAGDFDVLFFGSSLTRVHVIPEVFDERMRRHGYDLTSLNMGVLNMRAHELNAYLRALEPDLRGVQYVIIEDQAPDAIMRPDDRALRDTVWWHTPRMTWQAIELTMAADVPFREKVSEVKAHLGLMLRRVLLVGEGPILLDPPVWNAPVPALEERGFMPIEHSHFFMYERSEWESRVEALANQLDRAEAGPVTEYDRRLAEIDRWRKRLLERQGVEMLFFTPPSLDPRWNNPWRSPALRLNDPDEYPSLYRFEERVDSQHLNPEAARRLTIYLADAFAEWLRAQGIDPSLSPEAEGAPAEGEGIEEVEQSGEAEPPMEMRAPADAMKSGAGEWTGDSEKKE